MFSSSSSWGQDLGFPWAAHASPVTDSVWENSGCMRLPFWLMKSESPNTITQRSPEASSLPPSFSRKDLRARYHFLGASFSPYTLFRHRRRWRGRLRSGGGRTMTMSSASYSTPCKKALVMSIEAARRPRLRPRAAWKSTSL